MPIIASFEYLDESPDQLVLPLLTKMNYIKQNATIYKQKLEKFVTCINYLSDNEESCINFIKEAINECR